MVLGAVAQIPRIAKGIASLGKVGQAENISQYFNALRNWNKTAFKAGDFKTSPHVSDKNVFKANENRFNVLEKVTRAINENNTFDTKNKALKNVEDQFLKGELTQPTAGKGTKNQRSAFVSYQKLAEKDILNKFGEHTPQHILDAFANNASFKAGKASTAHSKRGVPFAESEDATKLISFMKNRFNKPNTLEELSSDILKEQNIVSLKGILENTARVEFQDYIKQISHKLPENVLKNYRDYASQRGLGGVATIEQKLALSPLATLLEGKIQKIPTSAKVPKNVKEQIARNNLAAFQEAHAQVPELVSKIRPLDRDLLRKRATDLQNYKDIYGEKNLLSHKEIAKIYGLKKRRELDRILGKELDFKNPLDRKIFNLQKTKLEPYKGQKFSGARAHPLETQWWKDLPETNKEIFRYPVDPTLSPINAFHQRLNKLLILSKEKRLDAIKRDDRKEIFRLDKNLKKIEDYIKELRITTTLPTGETISAYPPGTSLQHKMRMLVENQKELMKKLDIAKSDVNKMFKRKEGIKEGGLINGHLTDTSDDMTFPLLDPQESIDRQRFAVGGFASGATKIFNALSKVPRAVARVGEMKKPSFAKPSAAGEVAVAQAVEDKPAMFLSTVNAIEEMPDASRMGAQQWLGTIKNKAGVSATELDEFGLEPLLNNIAKTEPKRKLTKAELLETYNREMPKIDMDIAIAEPVSRGADDITNMLTAIREKGRNVQGYEDLDIFSNDARLLTALHQPPQDRVGFMLRGKLIDIMRGTSKTVEATDPINNNTIPLLKKEYHGAKMHKGAHFQELWESAFPSMFHNANKIVKEGHFEDLKHLVKAEDIKELSQSRNIPEEEAFSQLYQALNIFDRQVMTADVPIPFWTKKMLYRLGDMSEGRGFFYKSKKTPAHEGTQFIPGGSGYGELKFYQNFDTGAVRAQETQYTAGHFSGEVFKGNTGNSPFGWGRFSERIDESGRKILLMEEIQSDLHQAIAQKGYNYAPRLDKSDVLAEIGDFAKQLDKKQQTFESNRLRKENIMQLSRVEREGEATKNELKLIEKSQKKLLTDMKKLKEKVAKQEKETGRSGKIYPNTAFQKSENYAKVFMQGLMKLASDKGYDGIALSTGKMKKTHGGIPKGGDKFYDEIGVKAMKRMAKKSGFKFKDTTIVDGNGYSWEKIPLIEMRDINTGFKIPGESTIPVYKKGGIVNQNMVRGNNGY